MSKIIKSFKNLNFGFDEIIRVYYNLKFKKENKKENLRIDWSLAKKNIAGGNMLLSKRPEQYLPEIWPSHYEKSYGCRIVSSDKKNYYDLGLMGVGTNILGYSNKDVDKAVTKDCKRKYVFIELRRRSFAGCEIKKIHNWDGKVKFAVVVAKQIYCIRLAEHILVNIKLLFAVIMVGMIGTSYKFEKF